MYGDDSLRRIQDTIANQIQKGNAALAAPNMRNNSATISAQFAAIPSGDPTQASTIPTTSTAYRSNPWDERNLNRVASPSSGASITPASITRAPITATTITAPSGSNFPKNNLADRFPEYKQLLDNVSSNGPQMKQQQQQYQPIAPIRKPSEILPITNIRSPATAIPAATGSFVDSPMKSIRNGAPTTTTITALANNDDLFNFRRNQSIPAYSSESYTTTTNNNIVDYSLPPPSSYQQPYNVIPTTSNKIDLDSVEETLKRADKAIRNSLVATQPITSKEFTSTLLSPPSTLPLPLVDLTSAPRTTTYTSTTSPLTNYQPQVVPLATNTHQASTGMYLSDVFSPSSAAAITVAKNHEVSVYSTKWEDIIDRGERSGAVFSDSEFLPSPASIGGSYPSQFEWLRAKQFMLSRVEMFTTSADSGDQNENQLDPTSIVGGDLDNAYFQGVVSALAERDVSIFKLFQTKQVNTAGCYVLNICWKGVWTPVILDDKFPVKVEKNAGKQNQVCFSRSKPTELWMLLLEKAWAKLHGSYAKIDAGLPREVLHDLTGAPSITYFISGQDSISEVELWERINHADKNELIVVVSAMDDVLSVQQEKIADIYGVNNTHLYTVLGTISVTVNDQNLSFIKLRNPRCNQEWRENEVDKYLEELSEDIVHALSYGGRCPRQGYFLMEFNDFREFFSDLTIGYAYPGFAYTGEKVCNVRGSNNYLKIEISTPGYYFFQLSQESIRCEKIADQMYVTERGHYSKCYLAIASEIQPDQMILAVTGNQRDLTSLSVIDQPIYLPAGKYIASIRVDWKSVKSSSGNVGFGVYGSSPVAIRASSKVHCEVFAAVVEAQNASKVKWEEI